MSNEVFPTLPGLEWNVARNPNAPPVQKRSTPSRREFRARDSSLILYDYTLSYEFLRKGGGFAEWENLVGFFNRMGGSFDTFLFTDPDDNAAVAAAFGTGNGTQTAFQLARTLGGTSEPVFDVNGSPQIFINDWQGNTLALATPRTNLLWRSEDLTDAVWTKDGVTILANNNAAPDGTVTGDVLVENGANSVHRVFQLAGVPSASADFTLSAHLTSNGRNWAYLRMTEQTGGTSVEAFVNTSTGAVGQSSTGANWSNLRIAVNAVPGSHYRVAITALKTNAATSIACIAGAASADGVSSYAGSSGNATGAWGLQFEQASAATRYIKTPAGSAVTTTDYTLGANTGLVTFAVAPLNNAALSWTGSFYRRLRFVRDQLEFRKFMADFWDARKVELTQRPA